MHGTFLGPLDSLPAHIEGGQALAEVSREDEKAQHQRDLNQSQPTK